MNTLHIYKKELIKYFYSPIAYIFTFFFVCICSLLFVATLFHYADVSPMMMQMGNQQSYSPMEVIITPLLFSIGYLFIYLIPALTMRLFAEEKKMGVIELLFTYPVTELQLIFGKLMAALTVMLVMFAFTSVYMIIFAKFFQPVAWGVILSGYLGLILLALMFLSIGIFMSSLASDQVTAGLLTAGGLLVLWVVGFLKSLVNTPFQVVLDQISLKEHFEPFTRGIIDTHHIVYFLGMAFIFLFLTYLTLEKRKWQGVA